MTKELNMKPSPEEIIRLTKKISRYTESLSEREKDALVTILVRSLDISTKIKMEIISLDPLTSEEENYLRILEREFLEENSESS